MILLYITVLQNATLHFLRKLFYRFFQILPNGFLIVYLSKNPFISFGQSKFEQFNKLIQFQYYNSNPSIRLTTCCGHNMNNFESTLHQIDCIIISQLQPLLK